ncbi:GNAT family N-acetyltransferase [Nocardiopsis dassonvillei]|uniref:GNAT family N-acetyltransferase n=1 Tax=Nocardiopsis dassonvillei TaxID=2014 RepID=UPI00200F45E3|nr:GNAT family N-acetyltransferase [Nocardiopsis dassonvillei]MCK9871409.1 GNAT family N-acetyltransferase [Nocardiopsis dassonvillei]
MNTPAISFLLDRFDNPYRGQPLSGLFALSPETGDRYGFITWHDDGLLHSVGVRAPMRRRGIATALWNEACARSGSPLRAPGIRTVLGDAWLLHGLGIDVPWEGVLPPATSHDEAREATTRQLVVDDVEGMIKRILSAFNHGSGAAPTIRALCAPSTEEMVQQIAVLKRMGLLR